MTPEDQLLAQAYAKVGTVRGAARLCGMNRGTARYRLMRLGLHKPREQMKLEERERLAIEITKLYQRGTPVLEICSTLHVGWPRVHKIIQEQNLSRTRPSPIQDDRPRCDLCGIILELSGDGGIPNDHRNAIRCGRCRQVYGNPESIADSKEKPCL